MSKNIQYLIAGLAVAAIIGGVIYQGFETTVYFYTPQEVLAKPQDFRNKTIRIGALVEPGTVEWDADKVQLRFKVTEDGKNFIQVAHNGVKPDMFKEGQGVVVEGRLDAQNQFAAEKVLVKHSEEYKAEEHADKKKTYKSLKQ